MPKVSEQSEPLKALPGSQAEANAVAALLKTDPITGQAATEAAIAQKLASARFIHFATHGRFDDRNPLAGAIALAPSPNGRDRDRNGWLTASELLNYRLKAELVVLSACDTGRGQITGDGILGLSRSWFAAGVPSVIVSLWSVPDAPTADLMTEFYRHWTQQSSKVQALRQAMLSTMKKHPDPANWAAFTLIGEAE